MYEPKPIDTSDVILPEELIDLTEKIAENVHNVWAAGRMAEGLVYGEAKDTEEKVTPLLVPYGELPESEREYDRNTALETLKLIVKMGYVISHQTKDIYSCKTDDLACYLEPEVKKLKEEIEKQFHFPYEWAGDDSTDLA